MALRPDVVLMDLHMPVKGGVAATREITLAQPDVHVLVLTTLDDDETVFEAVRAGAHAYLLKDAGEDELLEAIRALRADGLRLVMLTGDNRTTAEAVARKLGIDQVLAEVLPQDKREVVQRLQAEGHVVAMAGDVLVTNHLH